MKQIGIIFKDLDAQWVSTCDPALRWVPTYDYNEKFNMKGRLRAFDPQKSTLSNVGPSYFVITLISTAVGVEWEGFLFNSAQKDLELGSAPGARYSLAIFKDM